MPGLHIQVAFSDAGGGEGFNFVNTFNVAYTSQATQAQAEAAIAAVADMYSFTASTLFKPSKYMSETLDGTALAHKIQAYDVSGVKLSGGVNNPLGPPVAEDMFTLDPSDATAPLPNEVAICVTLEGSGRAVASVELGTPPAVTRPKQRHTGRFYFGPLNTDAIYPGGAGETAMVHPSCITTLLDAIDDLNGSLIGAGALGLAVWSRANATMYPLEAVSVDRSFDIVRSRGTKPQQRTRRAL